MWQSILKGRDVLKEGLRWKVGDGTSIRIWSDPWLPSKFLPYISSPIPSGWEDARVSSLFDSSQQVWNLATLQQLFNPRDAKLINSIPLSTRPIKDVLIWLFTQTGSYTVKSGYRFPYKSQSLDNNDYQPADNTLWKKIWGLQVQPKVQNFMWRALKNSIPIKLNLRRRTILADDRCDQCKGATKDVIHALWSCPLLSHVLSHDSIWNYNATPHFASFRDLGEHIIDTGNDLNLFATMVWAIWYRRNFMRTNEQPFPIQQIFQEVQKARASFVRTIPPCPPKQPLVETQG